MGAETCRLCDKRVAYVELSNHNGYCEHCIIDLAEMALRYEPIVEAVAQAGWREWKGGSAVLHLGVRSYSKERMREFVQQAQKTVAYAKTIRQQLGGKKEGVEHSDTAKVLQGASS